VNTQPILVMTPNTLVEDLWGNAGRIDPLWNELDFSVWEIPPVSAVHLEAPPARVIAPFQP